MILSNVDCTIKIRGHVKYLFLSSIKNTIKAHSHTHCHVALRCLDKSSGHRSPAFLQDGHVPCKGTSSLPSSVVMCRAKHRICQNPDSQLRGHDNTVDDFSD